MVYSTGRFILCLTLCYFVLVFFSPFSIANTSLWKLSAFRTFVRFAHIWFCLFPLLLGVWKGLRFVIWHSLDFSLTFFFTLIRCIVRSVFIKTYGLEFSDTETFITGHWYGVSRIHWDITIIRIRTYYEKIFASFKKQNLVLSNHA